MSWGARLPLVVASVFLLCAASSRVVPINVVTSPGAACRFERNGEVLPQEPYASTTSEIVTAYVDENSSHADVTVVCEKLGYRTRETVAAYGRREITMIGPDGGGSGYMMGYPDIVRLVLEPLGTND